MSLNEEIKNSGVAVFHLIHKQYVPFIPCPGEKRVRLDVFDCLDNYAVVKVRYFDDLSFQPISTNTEDWRIDLSQVKMKKIHVFDDHWNYWGGTRTTQKLGVFDSMEEAKKDPTISVYIECGRIIGFYELIERANEENE